AAGDAASDGATGGSRTREAREDHSRRRRAAGIGETRASRGSHRSRAAGHDPAVLADTDGDRLRAELDDPLPDSARVHAPVPRRRREKITTDYRPLTANQLAGR